MEHLAKKNIIEEIAKVDYAFIDATFYDGNEISSRNISEIPHPFVIESMDLFKVCQPLKKEKYTLSISIIPIHY